MLQLNQETEKALVDDALRTYPDECCGFVFGTETDETERRITAIQVVDNAREGDKKRRFEITPADYLRAERYADEHGVELLGVYHSHPDHPSVPSEHDRVVAQPFFSYIIIAVRDQAFVSLQSWRLNDEFQFEEEQVAVSEN